MLVLGINKLKLFGKLKAFFRSISSHRLTFNSLCVCVHVMLFLVNDIHSRVVVAFPWLIFEYVNRILRILFWQNTAHAQRLYGAYAQCI